MTTPSPPPGGPAWTLDYPDVAFDAILAGSARAYAGRVAVRDDDLSLTFAEFHDRARRIAAGLRAAGIGPGDIVVLHQPNSVWFPLCYAGVVLSGAAACGANPLLPPEALADQITGLGASAVIAAPECTVSAAGLDLPGVRLIVHLPAADGTSAPAGGPREKSIGELLADAPLSGAPLSPDTLAHLQLTGGTTGKPKGVRILHRNLVASVFLSSHPRCGGVPTLDADGGAYYDPVEGTVPEDSELGRGAGLATAPMFHTSGLLGVLVNLLIGNTTVIRRRFSPPQYLADIEAFGVTRVLGAPALFHALLDSPDIALRDLSSVRHIMSGAAPIDTTTLGRLAQAFPHARVSEIYGLSEATSVLTMQVAGRGRGVVIGSVGVPAPNTAVVLLDADGKPVAPGEVGEICARGPQVADGYHRAPALTAAQFREGWLHTGDLGRFDEDGNLYVVGRDKDVIIYKGYNVYPVQLEELAGAVPGVREFAVVGFPAAEVGERPVGFLVPDGEQTDPEQVLAAVNARVVPYQRLRAVHLIDALPLTPAGKVDKAALRAEAAVRAAT